MYQTAPGFIHRKIADTDVLVSIGANVAAFNGYITLNETCALLWDLMQTPKTAEQLAESLTEQYDVTYQQALIDVDTLLKNLAARGVVREVAE